MTEHGTVADCSFVVFRPGTEFSGFTRPKGSAAMSLYKIQKNVKPSSFGIIKRTKLAAVGVVTVSLMALSTLSANAADISGANEVTHWSDAGGRNVILRQGTYNAAAGTGFGWAKIQRKHAIYNTNTVGFAVRNPNGGTAQGTDRLYLAYANKRVCENGYCQYTDSVPVRVVVSFAAVQEYYGVILGGQILGVKTAYCVNDSGVNDCPNWVDQSFSSSISNPRIPLPQGSNGSSTATVEASYAPLKK